VFCSIFQNGFISVVLLQIYEVLYEGAIGHKDAIIVLIVLRSGKEVEKTVFALKSLPPSRELELPEKAGGPGRRLKQKLGIDI
jgi:hypothetical protein